MAKYEITAEMNLQTLVAQTREVAQVLKEFADKLECIEKKYAEPQENMSEIPTGCSNSDSCENCKYNDGDCCRLIYEAKMESD